MKGLLLKEFYMAVKYYKMSFLIDIVFIAVSFVSKENLVFLIFPLIISGVLPITMLGFDEKFKWTHYSGALPYSAAQLVSVKYLFGLLVQAAASILIFAAVLVRNKVMDGAAIPLSDAAMMVGGIFVVSLIMPALCLPICFKFGTEKGRIIYLISMCALGAGIMSFIPEGEIPDLTELPVLIIFASAVVIYALSWLVSIAVYDKRDLKG